MFGLPLRNQSRTQALWGPDSEATLEIPSRVAQKTQRRAERRLVVQGG